MAHTLSEIIRILDNLAPPSLAEEWDNCGLQLGDLTWPVAKIWVALDPVKAVVEAACAQDVDLLITHHPLIFKSLKAIEFHTPLGCGLYIYVPFFNSSSTTIPKFSFDFDLELFFNSKNNCTNEYKVSSSKVH